MVVIMSAIRKKSVIKKPNIFDEIKVVKEEGDIESLEEIDEEGTFEEDLDKELDFDPDDRQGFQLLLFFEGAILGPKLFVGFFPVPKSPLFTPPVAT